MLVLTLSQSQFSIFPISVELTDVSSRTHVPQHIYNVKKKDNKACLNDVFVNLNDISTDITTFAIPKYLLF